MKSFLKRYYLILVSLLCTAISYLFSGFYFEMHNIMVSSRHQQVYIEPSWLLRVTTELLPADIELMRHISLIAAPCAIVVALFAIGKGRKWSGLVALVLAVLQFWASLVRT